MAHDFAVPVSNRRRLLKKVLHFSQAILVCACFSLHRRNIVKELGCTIQSMLNSEFNSIFRQVSTHRFPYVQT